MINIAKMKLKEWNEIRGFLKERLKEKGFNYDISRNSNGDIILSGSLLMRFDTKENELYMHGRCSRKSSDEISYKEISLIRTICRLWYVDLTR